MNTQIERSKVIYAVAEYFGIQTKDTTKSFVREQALELCKKLAELGLMLAGGAINSVFTGSHINDLDFYMKKRDPASIQACRDFLDQFFPEIPYQTDNAVSYSRKGVGKRVWRAQLITRFVGSPEYVLDSFDFTITQGLFDFETDTFVLGDRFLQDIARRRLVYCGKSHYPICAMYRTLKYQARGYKLPGSTVMHIALSIVRLDIKTYKDLKYQLMGIDTMYLQDLFNSKKYAENLPVDYGAFLVDAFNSIDDADSHELVDSRSETFNETWVKPIVEMFEGLENDSGQTDGVQG